MFGEKCIQLVERDGIFSTAIVEIGVDGTGDDHEFLVVRVFAVFDHVGIGVFAEIAGMGVLAVNQKDGAAYLIAVLKDGLIDEGLTYSDVLLMMKWHKVLPR